MAILYCWSGAAGTATGADWTNAKTTLTAAFVTEVAGDTIYVAHDHNESTAGAITLTSSGTIANPTRIICVNRAGSVPPVAADRRTTGAVSTTTSNITFNGTAHYDGIIFTAGVGAATTCSILLQNTVSTWSRYDNCSVRLASTGTNSRVNVAIGATYVELNNTTLSFAAVLHGISTGGTLKWRNTPSALLGTMPTTLIQPSIAGGEIECVGVDLSALGSGKTIVGALSTAQALKFKFIDCKLDAAVTKSAVPLAHGATEVDFIRCGASGNYNVFRHRTSGALDQETTIVRTGGASDGVTPLSWKVVTTADCTYSLPFECPPIAIWNDTTGSAVTATVEGIAAALPTDAECWLDVSYLSDASSPISSSVNDGKPDLITTAANQTSSSETWGGSTAAFKLVCTFTPQQKGWVYGRIKVGKASTTVYIDPLVTLS